MVSVVDERLCKKVGGAIENGNWLMDSAESDLVLQFDSEPIKIAEYAGTRYSIDMRSIAGPPLPEMLAVLEAFFGDGARLKIVVLPINGRRVLVANSTAQQIASVLNEISKTDPPANPHWTAARQLLPTALHQVWQLNLHDHTAWRQRILHAGHETIVGGPLVKIFPAGPPLTWGMRFQPQRLRLTVAVQGETLKHALSRH